MALLSIRRIRLAGRPFHRDGGRAGSLCECRRFGLVRNQDGSMNSRWESGEGGREARSPRTEPDRGRRSESGCDRLGGSHFAAFSSNGRGHGFSRGRDGAGLIRRTRAAAGGRVSSEFTGSESDGWRLSAGRYDRRSCF